MYTKKCIYVCMYMCICILECVCIYIFVYAYADVCEYMGGAYCERRKMAADCIICSKFQIILTQISLTASGRIALRSFPPMQ